MDVIAVGKPVSPTEAIEYAQSLDVVLPDVYYGTLQAAARQAAFSIAGIAAHEQLSGVLTSLTKSLATGGTFAQWKRESSVKELALPDYRKETVFRTNIQNSYRAGQWERIQRSAVFEFVMYDAINDARVRPTHLAKDGIIRRIDDPERKKLDPCGFNCRCRWIPLTEKQALARSRQGTGIYKAFSQDTMGRDKGWEGYDLDNRLSGVDNAITHRLAASNEGPLKTALTNAVKPKLINFGSWADAVLQDGYKAKHEFKKIGVLPDFVMADADVVKLLPETADLFISDHQLRHALRPAKSGRGAALPISIIKQLPNKIASAEWLYDKSHKNLIAIFDMGKKGSKGKAAIAIKFKKGKNGNMNAVVTTGVVSDANTKMAIYRKIVAADDVPITVRASTKSAGFAIPKKP